MSSLRNRELQKVHDRASMTSQGRRLVVRDFTPSFVRTSCDLAGILRLIGTLLFEQTDGWQTSSRHMMVAALSRIDTEEIAPTLGISTKAA